MRAAPGYTLVIGTKNWSSWSLRPWLLMTQAGLPFAEIEIGLRRPETPAQIRPHSPSGKLPVLKRADGGAIWDSLAIAEFLAERHPEAALWPADAEQRAWARAISAEMHAGFAALRSELPMDCLARDVPVAPSEAARRDIDRIRSIWSDARTAHAAAGPFLFGDFSIADSMYAPVVSRFFTYTVPVSPAEQRYMETIWALPAMARWLAGCAAPAGAHA